MKKTTIGILAVLLSLGYSCKETKKEADAASDEMEATMETETEEVSEEVVKFTMEPKSDSGVQGDVTFTASNGKVLMEASFTGLSAGDHAIHIHENADCSAADGTSAGGHWNPTGEPHGEWGDQAGYHKGDIGNFTASEDGTGSVEFETDQWCLDCDDPNKNIMGKAVIVHQGADDFTSQPSGAAGARVSCTGIIQ